MSRSTHRTVLRRFVHGFASMALGAGVLTGLTAATVLFTSSPAAAAAFQVPDCAISSGSGFEYNQVQNGTTLVPYMLFNG